ncbi:hypothetical protein [Salinihabitans flavidus]|uniref:hypothetical protein n=1 Tax=Salinihabitans flavidus TaxID=569882 RepID=UPI0011144CC8|nr:hypothetical protein [Salinihabitans flavidus]
MNESFFDVCFLSDHDRPGGGTHFSPCFRHTLAKPPFGSIFETIPRQTDARTGSFPVSRPKKWGNFNKVDVTSGNSTSALMPPEIGPFQGRIAAIQSNRGGIKED